jgi:hypothetical protein
MNKKPSAIEINGEWRWLCEYKNCRELQHEHNIYCLKHIGQRARDEQSDGMINMRRKQAITRLINWLPRA